MNEYQYRPLSGLRKQAPDPSALKDAYRAAALIASTKGPGEAARKAKRLDLHPRLIEGFEKAPVVAGNTAGIGISAFGPAVASAFMSAARNVGFADAVAADSMKFDDAYGRAYIYSSISAGPVVEGAAKVLRQMNASGFDLTPVKAANLIVVTRELIDALGDAGLRTLGQELKNGVAVATDAAFFTALSGNSTDSSISSADWASFLNSFEELLRLVDATSASKLYLIVPPEIGKGAAVAALANGVDSLAWNGGNLAGVEVRVSDAQTANRITLIDATGLATSMGELEFQSSEHASIEMVDSSSQTSATTIGAVSQVSMFQTGSYALRSERSISVKQIRTNAVWHMTGIEIGESAGSPAGA
jgi:hypothetical protein